MQSSEMMTGSEANEVSTAMKERKAQLYANLSVASVTPKGVEERYTCLIEPHRAWLRRYAYRLTGNVSEGEDLVQETMLRAYTRLHLLRGVDSIPGWLSTIQRNIFRNNLRRKDLEIWAHQPIDPDTLGTTLGGGTAVPEPEASTMRTERNRMIIKAVTELPSVYREVILLCDVWEESYQEIADRIGVPLGTVRSRIHRGRKLLRDSFIAWQHAH